MSITMIGLDTAKTVFQIHGVNETGKVEIKRKLRRSELIAFFEKQESCTVVMEACGAAHHWARMLTGLGHTVKLIAAEAVKPFVKKGKKSDAADAAAICEAASRPDAKFVPVKTVEQQGILGLHAARSLLVKQQTMLANAMRGLATEFGVTAPKGIRKLDELMTLVDEDENIPKQAKQAKQAITGLHDYCNDLSEGIETFEAEIVTHARTDETARRLATIPGIGPITASLIAATVVDISLFKTARQFAAWLGLVPRQNSTGGKTRLGRITKTGNREIRKLLVLGSRLPSFSYSTEHLDEDRLCNEHFREPLDQGLQAMFWHHGDKFVEHATLPEQGVSASRGRVGLEMSIEAERFPGCAEQGQQRNREGIDQPQAVTPVGGTDVHRAEAHAEANILTITERTLDSPPLGVEVDQLPCEFVGVAGGQAPRLLHAFGLHAHHSADRIADGGHCGTSHHARPAALADPLGCRPRLPVGSGHPDVATKADDEVELQLVGQHPV